MESLLKKSLLMLLMAVILGGGYYVLTQGTPLQTSVLHTQSTQLGNLDLNVTISQPTQDGIIYFGGELENKGQQDVLVVGMEYKLAYKTAELQLERDSIAQTYGVFPYERYTNNTTNANEHILEYMGYSGSGNQITPFNLAPAEKKLVFSFAMRSVATSPTPLTVSLTVQQGSQTITVPAASGSQPTVAPNCTNCVVAINAAQNITIPITLYALGNPDLNFDGVVDSSDAQYLMEEIAR